MTYSTWVFTTIIITSLAAIYYSSWYNSMHSVMGKKKIVVKIATVATTHNTKQQQRKRVGVQVQVQVQCVELFL